MPNSSQPPSPILSPAKVAAPAIYVYQSPIGPLTLALDSQESVSRLSFGETKSSSTHLLPPQHPLSRSLDHYFKFGTFADPVEVSFPATDFQRRVLDATGTIPAGQSRTYSWVAAQIGMRGASRAVGGALGRNPVPILVPCHRVVATGRGGGYAGGLPRKKFLLDLEQKAGAPTASALG